MSSNDDIRAELLKRLKEHTLTPQSEEVEEEVPSVTSSDLGCRVSFNDVFEDASRAKLPNFSLDPWLDSFPDWSKDQLEMIPTVDPMYKEQTGVLWLLTYCLVNDEIALLQGYQGTGKTSGIEYVCAKLEVPLMRINCSTTQESSSIAGSLQVVNEGGVPVTKYVSDTHFINYMSAGVVCLLDEIFIASDDLRGGTLMRFRDRPLVGNRVITAPEDTTGSHGVEVHSMSRLVYADNTLGLGDNADKFSARHVADTAFLDGINFVIKVDYLPEDDEAALLLDKVPDLNKVESNMAYLLIRLANLVRKAYHNGDLSITMSLRTLVPVARQTVMMKNPVTALTYGFYNKLGEDTERDTFKDLVTTVGLDHKYGGFDV